MLVAGGGGTFALVQAGMIGGTASHAEAKKEVNEPKLVRKGEEDPYAPKTEAKEGEAPADVEGEGGSEYRTSYYNFTEDFTSNLKNSAALVQINLACSTRRDGRVLMWLKKHELAIRSEILVVLAFPMAVWLLTLAGVSPNMAAIARRQRWQDVLFHRGTQAFSLLVLAALIPGGTGGAAVLAAICVALTAVGAGVGMGWPHLLTGVLRAAPAGETDLTSAAITTVQLVATALGAALAGMVVNMAGLTEPGGAGGTASAALWLFLVFAAAPVLALISARRLTQER